jgi:hypothetical protein
LCVNAFEGASSSSSDVDRYVIRNYWTPFPMHAGNQNLHTTNLVEHTGLLFCRIAYSRKSVSSNICYICIYPFSGSESRGKIRGGGDIRPLAWYISFPQECYSGPEQGSVSW